MLETMKKREVAAKFGVTERTIENWVKQGKLPAPGYLGGRPYWLAAAIEEFIFTKFKLSQHK